MQLEAEDVEDGDELVEPDRRFVVLDLADEARADDVERRRLAGDDPAAVEPAEHERPDAVRVAEGLAPVTRLESIVAEALDKAE